MLQAGGSKVLEKLDNPVKFQWETGGSERPPPSVVYGFESDLLIDVNGGGFETETLPKIQFLSIRPAWRSSPPPFPWPKG
jgi:hypothetical protein